jgi:TPP-dependent pyruvate/acetoin dehydrogenase alpha subunit
MATSFDHGVPPGRETVRTGGAMTEQGNTRTLAQGAGPVGVFEAAGEAIGRARQGGGPSLVEVETDRLRRRQPRPRTDA